MHSHQFDQHDRPNLYLVGMMGTGKSTIGKKLALSRDMGFIDSDKSIEDTSGLSVSEIFAKHGEEYFRKLESDFIDHGHDTQNLVVACGGGLCIAPGMMEALKSLGIVICLWANPETLIDRTKTDQSRPLLQVAKPLEQLQKLISERENRYREAHYIVETDNLSADAVVEEIQKNLELGSPES